jgi:hypothetical protein
MSQIPAKKQHWAHDAVGPDAEHFHPFQAVGCHQNIVTDVGQVC